MKKETRWIPLLITTIIAGISIPASGADTTKEAKAYERVCGSLEKARDSAVSLENFARCARDFAAQARRFDQLPVSNLRADESEITAEEELKKRSDALSGASAAEAETPDKKGEENFIDKLGFGVGVSMVFGSDERAGAAEIINGTLRVTDDNTNEARLALESHYFFGKSRTAKKGKNGKTKKGAVFNSRLGHGPFVTISTGPKNESIDSFGLGWMIGLRDKNDEEGKSWNLGLGYVWDNDVQVLADGFTENAALPAGAKTVKFKKETQGGIIVLFSRGFK